MEDLLKLVRIAVGTDNGLSVSGYTDWSALVASAIKQGVAAIAFDGLQKCYGANPGLDLPLDRELKALKYDWFGTALGLELSYEEHHNALSGLVRTLGSENIKVMLLKGYGLSLNYPVPAHRPKGDIDIYCFGDYGLANETIRNKGIDVDERHHKHSVFSFSGQMVENHYSFLNTVAHLSTAKLEAILEDLVKSGNMIPVEGFFIPSADFNALYLLRHMAEHFASTGCFLRHLLDWALFCRRFGSEIDVKGYQAAIREVGMGRFLRLVNRECVKYLGFPEETFGFADGCFDSICDEGIVDRVMGDILSREYGGKAPDSFLAGLAFKFRRWMANGWKHDLVFPESRLGSFITQVWSHLLRPGSL